MQYFLCLKNTKTQTKFMDLCVVSRH